MRLSQAPDPVANVRKRRSLQTRACECECDRVRVYKKQKKTDRVADGGLRALGGSGIPQPNLPGEKEEEEASGDHSQISPGSGSGPGQRRSLRLRGNLRNDGHLETKKACPARPERKEGVRVERKQALPGAKKEGLRAGKEGVKAACGNNQVSQDGIDGKLRESWDTRLRHRLRNAKPEIINPQPQVLKEVEVPRKNEGGVRTRSKIRREEQLDGCNPAIPLKAQDVETGLLALGSWARKSKRKLRSGIICKGKHLDKVVIPSNNALPDLNSMQPDLACNDSLSLAPDLVCKDSHSLELGLLCKDSHSLQPDLLWKGSHVNEQETLKTVVDENKDDSNLEPSCQKSIDGEAVDGSLSPKSVNVPDREDPDNKPILSNLIMRSTVVPRVLQIENTVAAHDLKFHLEVMLDGNAVREPQDEIPCIGQGLEGPTAQSTATVISQSCMIYEGGMAHIDYISDSENSTSDLGVQARPQKVMGSSMLAAASREVMEDVDGIGLRDTLVNVDEIRSREAIVTEDDMSVDEAPLEHKINANPVESSGTHDQNAHVQVVEDVTEPGDKHCQDAQPEVAEDTTDSTDKFCLSAQPEVIEDVTELNNKDCQDVQPGAADDITEPSNKHYEVAQPKATEEMTKTEGFDLRDRVKPGSDASSEKENHNVSFRFDKPVIIEGRKCGLCGRGNDGKPPKKLFQDTTDSDNEMSGELQPFNDEPKYQDCDGFGDDPGWLGHLLGPLSDRFGIAGVWVHRQCAVWSPEVYFSGVGCLKNVRAALSRGRSLKCSRCGRPGATIGCRVDRCPRTYHLACGRVEGCVFDHRKYLMACTDHLHMFRPRGGRSRHEMQRMRFRRMVMERRKASAAALCKDLEAEEKWLDNCGEDEEFLRRERKRLHRDLSRIAPVYIGGSSCDSDKFSEGWESVAGLQNVVQCMKEVVILPLLYPECFDSLGITPPRGVLLHGYPGTGKTLVVRALVGACARGDKRIAYFARKGADCLGKYVGDAERQLRLLFQVAEQCQPSVIFFDEIDGLAPKRSRQQDQTHSSVVSTLLALMDGLKSRGSIVVIGATNRPEDLDPALRRPGRFDREIYFPLPSVQDRAAILGLHTRRWPKPPSGDILSSIAKQTPGYAGADLQALCTQAAMIALKRHFPLQELLCCAEKNLEMNQLPSRLPFTVKENDWAAALAQAPPPCSRRAASMAVNDVIAVPLQRHMVPALLRPLVDLIIFLYLDGRIALPPILSKAGRLIENIVKSTLEEKIPSNTPWWSSLHSMSPASSVAKAIEKGLFSVGLIYEGIESLSSDCLLSSCEDITGDIENSSFKSAEACIEHTEKLKLWKTKSKGFGVRIMIAGDPKCGQKYLASCILYGFEGHVEIHKLNLSTMSQEGHGDIIQGLTNILGNCLSIVPCVIFMPRIEMWALEKIACEGENKSWSGPGQEILPEGVDLLQGNDNIGIPAASQTWNVLVQQVGSIPPDVPLHFLATCELPEMALPFQIRKFFVNELVNVSSSSFTLKQTIPQFSVRLATAFDCKLLFDQAAKNLTRVLIRRYIQFIHEVSHADCMALRNSSTSSSHGMLGERLGKIERKGHCQAYIERADVSLEDTKKTQNESRNTGCLKGSQSLCGGVKNNTCLSSIEPQHFNLKHGQDWQEQWPTQMLRRSFNQGFGKGRTALQLAIATCGYQLLHYPQFAQLCWVTSKLNEGPCTTIDGPWKGWPFNSCIVDATSSQAEVPSAESSGEHKDVECSVVRGLVAVGLLAYKGFYITGKEVAREIRRVLELLIKRIKSKIQNGKDKSQFLPLLAQAASLEDMVNSWAYAIQSLENNLRVSGQDTPFSHDGSAELACNDGRAGLTSRALNNSNLVECRKANALAALDAFQVSDSDCNKDVPKDPMSSKVLKASASGPDRCAIGSGSAGPNTSDSNNDKLPNCQDFHPQVVSLVPYTSGLSCVNPISGDSVIQNHMASSEANECHDSEMTILGKAGIFSGSVNGTILDFCSDGSGIQMNVKQLKLISANCHVNDGENVPPFDASADINTGNMEPIAKVVNQDILSNIEMQCAYHCCSECVHMVHLLVKQYLMNCWKAEGCFSRLENIHDLVASCTVHVMEVMARFGSSNGTGELKDLNGGQGSTILSDKNPCSCQVIDATQLMQMSSRREANVGTEETMRRECKCHVSPRRKSTRRRHGSDTSCLEASLKFVFTDHICNSKLKSLDGARELQFHCQTENVCFCSLIQRLLTIKQPL